MSALCWKVKERVQEIASVLHDDEVAHIKEDVVWRDVLRHIARGKCENPRRCSRIALETSKLNFCRWYA